MRALKLFVSHSSRLDDVEHKYTRDDRNWCLLEDTCRAIRDYYGDSIDLLVDQDGLVPGEDWNHQLNLWLAECHVAIILISKRAIEKSDWVAKEATVLSWRAEIDQEFKLIPVLLADEVGFEDLAHGYGHTLQIAKWQCVRDARCADDVLEGVIEQLGEPDQLPAVFDTPFDLLQGGIAKLLGEGTTVESLGAAYEAACQSSEPRGGRARQDAKALARCLFNPPSDDPSACFERFKRALQSLYPPPKKERGLHLFKSVRPMWVDLGAASYLPRALHERFGIVLSGAKLHWPDPDLQTEHYTLDRYLERAWPGPRSWLLVSVTGAEGTERIRQLIRETAFTPAAAASVKPEKLDERLNADTSRWPVLVVATSTDSGGVPDVRRLRELEQLRSHYPKLLLVLTAEPDHDLLPESIVSVEPALDPQIEEDAYLGESGTCMYLKQIYGTC